MPNKLDVSITRDENGEAGYTVANILIKQMPAFVVSNVEPTGPARIAGLSDEHVGWQVDRVNNTDVLCPEQGSQLLQLTRKPLTTFKITLTRVFDSSTEAKLRALFATRQ